MAFTITATPAAYSSINDDLIYTVAFPEHTSDSALYPNYKFIADVYIGGALEARIKKVQDPITGIGIFNIGQIVRNYVNATFNPGSGLVAQAMGEAAFNLPVQVKFGEEYAYEPYLDQVVDSVRTFFNHYNGRLVGNTSALSDFTNKVASRMPDVRETLLTSTHLLVPYFPTTTTPVSVTVTPIGGGSGFATSFTPANAYDLQVLNLAPVNLNTLHAGTINASTTRYTVLIGSQTYSFNIVCEPIYTPYMLHFFNRYGGFESKLFSKLSRRTLDIDKKDFGKVNYSVDGSGIVNYKNANNVYNETRAVYSVQYVEKMSLNSDILTDGEYGWLEDLVLSPLVYLQEGLYFFPILIKESNYEPRKVINDDLTNLSINIEFGTTNQTQSR